MPQRMSPVFILQPVAYWQVALHVTTSYHHSVIKRHLNPGTDERWCAWIPCHWIMLNLTFVFFTQGCVWQAGTLWADKGREAPHGRRAAGWAPQPLRLIELNGRYQPSYTLRGARQSLWSLIPAQCQGHNPRIQWGLAKRASKLSALHIWDECCCFVLNST